MTSESESNPPGPVVDEHHDDSETGNNTNLESYDAEDWEQELDNVIKSNTEICDWKTLRNQIQNDLQKQKTLPLSQINQLLILSNFATLRLKGVSHIDASLEIARQWRDRNGIWFARRVCALARHYQIFEQLPVE
jgi:hypothetical protein